MMRVSNVAEDIDDRQKPFSEEFYMWLLWDPDLNKYSGRYV